MLPVSVIPVSSVLAELVDSSSFKPWTREDLHVDPDGVVAGADYLDELTRAQSHTGHEESVVVGEARIGGEPAVLILGDFDFLAGSVGRAACQFVIAAFDRAAELALPVIASPCSGGTRMQEGTAAFVLMADVAAAVHRFRAAGNAMLTWLRHPTTGGVMATWGSLGTVTIGQPGALAGFLGPRVYRDLVGESFPADVQVTDNLAAHGVIDAVVDLADLKSYCSTFLCVVGATDEHILGIESPEVLRLEASFDQDRGPEWRPQDEEKEADPQVDLSTGSIVVDLATRSATASAVTLESPAESLGAATDGDDPSDGIDPWECVLRTRQPGRPTAMTYLSAALTDVTWISGTGEGERSDAVMAGFGHWRGIAVAFVAQDRAAQAAGAPLGPSALRTVRRVMRLADELEIPLVSLVDTAGGELSQAAEEAAMAGEIARCLAQLTTLSVPTVSVLLGMGCGGAALAMMPADVVIATESAWVSPLPLEGASIIRHRTPEHAPQMARDQRVAAWQLAQQGIVDLIVNERGDAAVSPRWFAEQVAAVVHDQLVELLAEVANDRLSRRRTRYHGGLYGN